MKTKKKSKKKVETLAEAILAIARSATEESYRLSVMNFICESNRIEGINREPFDKEVAEFYRFMELDKVRIADLERFVAIYQPGAKIRSRPGMDVHIGMRQPMPGGPSVPLRLQEILDQAKRGQVIVDKDAPDSAFLTHIAYEHLHPFMDGNGRSGRMLWAWQMQKFPLGFFHHFYYQTLAHQKDQI